MEKKQTKLIALKDILKIIEINHQSILDKEYAGYVFYAIPKDETNSSCIDMKGESRDVLSSLLLMTEKVLIMYKNTKNVSFDEVKDLVMLMTANLLYNLEQEEKNTNVN